MIHSLVNPPVTNFFFTRYVILACPESDSGVAPLPRMTKVNKQLAHSHKFENNSL